MSATDDFARHVAKRDAAKAERDHGRVTWRKAILPGGSEGWSGIGAGGALLFVRLARGTRWDGAKYEYGSIDGKVLVLSGGARTIRQAKERAAALLSNRDSLTDPTGAPSMGIVIDTATQEAPTMTDQIQYGSPEAKAEIKRLHAAQRAHEARCHEIGIAQQAIREAVAARNPGARSWETDPLLSADERVQIDALAAEWTAERAAAWDAKCARIRLQTTPLPVASDWDLPARMLDRGEETTPGPVDVAAYQPGDLVALYSRGAVREAIVVSTGKSRVEVAYTTATALREGRDRDEMFRERGQAPRGPVVTRKTVPTSDLFNHRPTAPAAATTPEEETTMSKSDQTQTEAGAHRKPTTRSRKRASTEAVVEPVVELPQADAPTADPEALATAVLDYFAEATDGHLEVVASPSGQESRLRLAGQTIAYMKVGKRVVSFDVKGESGYSRTTVKSQDDVATAGKALVAVAATVPVPTA